MRRDNATDMPASGGVVSPWVWPVASAVYAIIGYLLQRSRGIGITPDGWAYWQGAVSLAHGEGYKYFSGNAIVAWPPLYSLYLAGWIFIFGSFGASLIAANAALVGIQVALWVKLAIALTRDHPAKPHTHPLAAAAFYIATAVPLTEGKVLAHNLLYTLLPAFLLLTWRASKASEKALLLFCGAAAPVAAACLLTHNSALVFMTAAAILVALRGTFRSFTGAALLLIIPLTIWETSRVLLGQVGSHRLDLRSLPIEKYLTESIAGIAQLIFPGPLGLMILIFLIVLTIYILFKYSTKEFVFSLSFVVISLILLIAMFSLSNIYDALSDRFLLFIPIIAVPLLLIEAYRIQSAIFLLIFLLLIPAEASRSFKWSFLVRPTVDNRWFVARSAELARAGAAISINGQVLVGPIVGEEPSPPRASPVQF